jgi:hypothetical protein
MDGRFLTDERLQQLRIRSVIHLFHAREDDGKDCRWNVRRWRAGGVAKFGVSDLRYPLKAALVLSRFLDNASRKENPRICLCELWQDTVGTITRYITSRDDVTISTPVVNGTTFQITLNVDDSYDYDVPLTFNTELPSTWKGVHQVTHDGMSIPYSIRSEGATDYVTFDLIPDDADVRIFGTPYLPGDFDGDNDVDVSDLRVWRARYGGELSGPDFLAWQRFQGSSFVPQEVGSQLPIPEPAGLSLGIVSTVLAIGVSRHQRRRIG